MQPVQLHGSLGREAATGRGTVFATRELLKHSHAGTIANKTFVIQVSTMWLIWCICVYKVTCILTLCTTRHDMVKANLSFAQSLVCWQHCAVVTLTCSVCSSSHRPPPLKQPLCSYSLCACESFDIVQMRCMAFSAHEGQSTAIIVNTTPCSTGPIIIFPVFSVNIPTAAS